MKKERVQALDVLTALFRHQVSLSQSMAESPQMAPMTKEICFGVCRHYIRLEAIASCLVPKKPKSLEVYLILFIGLYQLQYMNAPDYAVVKETVALLDTIKKTWAKGLINAALRRFCREREIILSSLKEDPQFVHGQPQWLLQRYKTDWPMDWQDIARENDRHPPMTLRVNLKKNSVAQYLLCLKEAGIEAIPHPIVPSAITLAQACLVSELPGFAQGCVSVQDAAAQLAVSLLSLRPGQRVLDACAAPGGKTGHMLETEPDLAQCLALDLDAKRLKRVADNLNRLGLNASIVQGDALEPQIWWDNKPFDRILLDAPCSATGVIRRHADIKLLRTAEEISTITQIQKAMLHALWPLLAPGGRMVYATCSVMAVENNLQMAEFLKTHPDAQCLKEAWPWGRALSCGQQILPGELGMDGFFYSVLLKQ